ncbi:MAG: hypothetical protein AB1555_09400 [Nitrospirota bacterium]
MIDGWLRRKLCRFTGVLLIVGMGLGTLSPASAEETGNMVVFKGGFMRLNSDRANEVFTDAQNVNSKGFNDGQNGWYVGAWLDNVLSKDSWGLMSGVWAMGEIGLQFNRISSRTVQSPPAAGLASGALDGGTNNQRKLQLTMVTIDIAPKLKFMEGSAFRPWLIPVGLDIHVISPPSNQTQYLDVGVQFAGGFEYRVWKAFHVGADVRYHLAANMTNTENSYFQVGPYVGIAF